MKSQKAQTINYLRYQFTMLVIEISQKKVPHITNYFFISFNFVYTLSTNSFITFIGFVFQVHYKKFLGRKLTLNLFSVTHV